MMIKTLFLLSFLFFIYSFIGWILEVVQSAFHQKRLVNRGFINSPLCISYGIGAIVITINTHQMTGLWIFAAAMIDATVIEWFGGHFIEHFYHERWWDYSKKLFNLNGRVCLEGFVCFGLFSVAATCLIQPFFDKKLALIPYTVQIVLIVILVTIFVVDLIRSVHIATHLKKEMEEMVKVLEREQMRIHQKFADYEVELEHLKNIKTLRGLIDQINIELKNKHYRYGSRRILKAFPYLVKKRIQETHERIREKE